MNGNRILESTLEVAKRADEFFIGTSPIHQAMQRLAKTLGKTLIPLPDVINLIASNRLPLGYADSPNPYVADKFRELWRAAQITDDY